MKMTYQNWWQVFQFEYRITSAEDVKESGVYYNEKRKRFEAHYKAKDNKPSRVVAALLESQLDNKDKKVSSMMMKELCLQLERFYERNNIEFKVPQLKGIA